MELRYQEESFNKLKSLADSNIHSIILQGSKGSGKTYLAGALSKYMGIPDFVLVEPKVSELRECIEGSLKVDHRHIICIENLDMGVDAAAQVILKYLEEPNTNLYIIITCFNSAKLPSTILSRAVEVNLHPPTEVDLGEYASSINPQRYDKLKDTLAFKSCKSLNEVKSVLELPNEKVTYFEQFVKRGFWNDSFNSITWNMNHYDDNSKIDTKLPIRVILNNTEDKFVYDKCLEALLDLELGRISEFAVLNKLVMNIRDRMRR